MEHSELQVKSFYLNESNEFKFYIKHFKSIIKYIYLANNYNRYYLIITNESENDILSIKDILKKIKKNPEFDINNLVLLYSNEEQEKWCFNSGLLFDKYNDDIIFNDYIPIKQDEIPSWVFLDKIRFAKYYNDHNIKIIHLEGLNHNSKILHLLNNNIYTLVSLPWFYHKWLYENNINTLFTLNPNYNKKNIIILSPDLDNILFSYEYGFNSILANHNCFIDYNKFNIQNKELIYNMVMNCRPELWKQPFLAETVNNLAYIKGACYGKEKYDYSNLKCKFMNESRLTPTEVIDICNKSYCGGIFSLLEGACYSSSEYLLCGLPVISTNSKGGRDTWYTNENSIIVESNKEDVVNAVNMCIRKINTGEFNKENIRSKHIQMSNFMRSNIINVSKYIFNLHKIHINPYEHWNTIYFDKFIKTFSIKEIEDFLQS
jgi:glycosyltransferase involved in cell wall biosynthesis